MGAETVLKFRSSGTIVAYRDRQHPFLEATAIMNVLHHVGEFLLLQISPRAVPILSLSVTSCVGPTARSECQWCD